MLRRYVAVGALAAAALLSGGCAAGRSTAPGGLTSVAPTTTGVASAPDSTDSAPAGPLGGDKLPAGFPVPPGIIGAIFVSNEGGGAVGATCGVGSPKAAYDFYRSALPAAGYTITKMYDLGGSDSDASFIKAIDFSGNGYNGRVLLLAGRISYGKEYADGGTVDITLRRP